MPKDWSKWGWDFWASVARHLVTVFSGWSGLNGAHAAGADVPAVGFKGLGYMLLFSVLVPSIVTFLEKNPKPDDIVVAVVPILPPKP